MDLYFLIKTLHIISATIVFGTGIGIANFMFFGTRSRVPAERAFAARMTVKADFIFTLPSVIIQPLSGAWLIWQGGFLWDDYWLALTYGLYILAAICWVPVVFIQIRMKALLERQARGGALDEATYSRLFRLWFALGWPAFGGLILIFWLMVTKPTW
ncbi:Protein of unknown function DUF2269, transmembrane [Sphingobium chlorophenolicum L-1]|uniref:Integral membrane protein n=1 Tax=Sphingobium chlorophenolicum L-1 TaxID=690566 RepID=F6EYI1_SPHCR|nr:DUF2269 domain-containing protein [Sphingobium chlorophenolicum]AEG49183.1 Protein of unknown function DUF2269, transmembrane [Sphingobium chlorophenolicum L-1]